MADEIKDMMTPAYDKKKKKEPSHTRKHSKTSTIMLAVLVLVLILVPFVFAATSQEIYTRILTIIGLYLILALGLNILVGYAGQLDFGRIAFYAAGAYAGMIIGLIVANALPAQFAGLSFIVAILAGVAGAALLGGILSLAVLRLRGDYLTIVTLGFAEIIRVSAQNNILHLTGGAAGIPTAGKNLPMPIGLAWLQKNLYIPLGNSNYSISFSANIYWYLLILLFVIIAIIITRRQENSRTGRAWAALKDDDVAARAMGINTTKTKTSAIMMSAIWGGVAGALFAYVQGMVSPETFAFFGSILVLAIVVIGGMGSTKGVIIGAIIIYGTPELIRAFAGPSGLPFIMWQLPLSQNVVATIANYRNLVLGLLMVVMMAWRPDGIIPMVRPKRFLTTEAQKKIEGSAGDSTVDPNSASASAVPAEEDLVKAGDAA
ncbi:MAG: hypothetical protein FWF45_03730 [Coriobacteriia bacterium]|nr:hypothetical protein [Coriobacteriia bacterium]